MDMIDIVEASGASGFPGPPDGWSNVVTRRIEYSAYFSVLSLIRRERESRFRHVTGKKNNCQNQENYCLKTKPRKLCFPFH